jgi:integrase
MDKVLSFEQEWTRQCSNRPQILRFMREAIGVVEVQWGMLTTLNLSKVRDHICTKVAGNSACTYLAVLKAFLSRYTDEGVIPCKNPAKELKTKRVPSQNVFLTESEIELIEKYKPKNDCERDIKAAFLIECYLGARRCDVLELNENNIMDGRIVYVSKKTHVECSVPIHRNLLKYLHYKPKKSHERAVYNRTIQRICREVGITTEIQIFYHGKLQKKPKCEFVGSHTARRSFCSNLAQRGVDIYTIASLAGHQQNITMTQRYIIPDTDQLSAEAMSFFAGK